ncbi:restriction endonuclease subunit S [Streptomyces tagetis]|uniref:Restriction endonuclease subunit S n=1 Tax=Streptomyces tagetis TaxID=2820809 RepID=A0A941B3Y9_9ACTN|nr:restriction endonuclease subunit S [Streptomyces sp. RG38]MBQ0830816.1 restriction endonuclease subunit S [Streptomyces sp. RG38]
MTGTRGGTEASDTGLHLPEGWRCAPLRDLCASLRAGPASRVQDKGHTQADGGVPVVLPRDLGGQRITTAEPGLVPAVPRERARALEQHLLAEGDILITRTGNVGRLALVTGEHSGWLFHANLVRMRLPGAGPAQAPYLAAYLSSGTAQDWVRARTAGSVIPSVSIRTLGELPVPLPPQAEQRAIGATLAALDEKIRAHTEIARTTVQYRAVLADALLTGVVTAQP